MKIFSRSAIVVLGAVFGLTSGAAMAAETHVVIDAVIGKACWIEGYTNTSITWTVTVKDGDTTAAELQGSGVNFNQMAVTKGNARFDVSYGVVLEVSNNSGRADLKIANPMIMADHGGPAVFGALVGGEDGGDDDWQDLLLNVTCLHNAG